MNYLQTFKDNVNMSTVVSAVVAAMLIGVGSFALRKLQIKPVTSAVNIATKGAKK